MTRLISTMTVAVLGFLASTGVAQTTSPSSARPARTDRPNVLFIALDDLRDWVGYAKRNTQTITPNIDRLAARGVAFTRAYCAAPVCNPSRAALMSGLRPSTTGVYENNNDWRRVIPTSLPLTTTFRNAGYHVAGSGKIYHEAYKRRVEWDDYLEDEGKDPLPAGDTGVGGIRFAPLDCRDEDLRDHRIVDYAIGELGKSHDKPFFLACGLHRPHMPWNVPRKYYDLHPLDSIQLPPTIANDLDDVPPAGVRMAKPNGDHQRMLDSGRWKEAVQGYLAAVSYADFEIGRLIDALDRSAYGQNTIVVLWGDHGWHLGEKQHWRKFALWEEATRAPLVWVAPGITMAGVTIDTPIDFMTIYPTLTDLCGIATPSHVQGRSVRPLLDGSSASWPELALTTYRFNNHAVRSPSHRYTRYANGDEELYDEKADPNEWTNLAARSDAADTKHQLATHLPAQNKPDIGGRGGEEDAADGETRRERRQRRNQTTAPSTQPAAQP